MNIGTMKKIYFIGIKGSGMTAIAEILHGRGIDVRGSDTSEVFFTDAILKRAGIKVFEKFAAENVPRDADVIVFSTAYNAQNNVEMKEAQTNRTIPLVSYPEMLAMLFRERLGIAVCGSHGKTTTTALLATALKAAGIDPSAIVGSKVIEWESSVLSGNGDYFIAEADEYQNKLRYYDPWAAILTSVDWDHPDYFPDFNSYKDVFKDFVMKIPKTGFLTVWGDSASTVEVTQSCTAPIHTYGFGEENEYRIVNHDVKIVDGSTFQSFEIVYREKNIGTFEIQLLGKHNVVSPTMASFTQGFGLENLIGKTLATISDARLAGYLIGNQSSIIERLLSISGEDALSIDRKYKEAVTFKLSARIMIATNELPRLQDHSDALSSRFIVLRLTESFFGKENMNLTEQLAMELPGILLWAIDGRNRLLQRGHFMQPKSSQSTIEEFEELTNPIKAFVNEKCVLGNQHVTPINALYAEYLNWCEATGRNYPGDVQTFGRNLKSYLPNLVVVNSRIGTGRVREYKGIGLQRKRVAEF